MRNVDQLKRGVKPPTGKWCFKENLWRSPSMETRGLGIHFLKDIHPTATRTYLKRLHFSTSQKCQSLPREKWLLTAPGLAAETVQAVIPTSRVMREPMHQKAKAEENRGQYPLRAKKKCPWWPGALPVLWNNYWNNHRWAQTSWKPYFSFRSLSHL